MELFPCTLRNSARKDELTHMTRIPNAGRLSPTVRSLVRQALEEDIGSGDVTSRSTLSPRDTVTGAFVAKTDGVVAGLRVAAATFTLVNPKVKVTVLVRDGQRVTRGTRLATVKGPARAVLSAERTALNLLQRMSGIATATAKYVDAVKGTKAVILDTRKTAPLLRPFDKMAVTLGGGTNHRFGLFDMAFVKDNHIAAVGSITDAVARIRRTPARKLPLIVEVTCMEELAEALALTPPPTRILLDNMSVPDMKVAVKRTAGRVPLEASGNVNLSTVRAIAETGVDCISVGSLTHSVTALDISLEIDMQTQRRGRMKGSATFRRLKKMFGGHAPESELMIKADLVDEIETLKKERNAVILGHNYMEQVLFNTVPDFRGDSLELSRKAAQTDKDVIVFCGVAFMAETAKLLNPGKRVLVPSEKAGCSLAASITADDVRRLKKKYPGVPVVTYVNTYADVKAETDVCCTSGNAAKVVAWAAKEFKTDRVIFLPDRYLAGNIARETGKTLIFPSDDGKKARLPANHMVGWRGMCEVHDQFTVDDIVRIRKEYPDVYVMSHPECRPEVTAASDYSGSTTVMMRKVAENPGRPILLLTECSMADNIMAQNPDANMLRLCMVRCPHMNTITLTQTRDALKHMQYEVTIPNAVQEKARRAVERMIAIG